MGLDIYLTGRASYLDRHRKPEDQIDGMPIEEVRVKLGYWRKDWVLHNHMLAEFGTDADNELALSASELRELLGAIYAETLKNEDGTTYTGEHCAEYGTANTLDVLTAAIEWVDKAPEGEWRDAVYWGSW